jgi:hypothetical protein
MLNVPIDIFTMPLHIGDPLWLNFGTINHIKTIQSHLIHLNLRNFLKGQFYQFYHYVNHFFFRHKVILFWFSK